MTQPIESTTTPTGQDIAVVQGWATDVTDIAQRLGPFSATPRRANG